jgi:hypothetical protein
VASAAIGVSSLFVTAQDLVPIKTQDYAAQEPLSRLWVKFFYAYLYNKINILQLKPK